MFYDEFIYIDANSCISGVPSLLFLLYWKTQL